MIRFFLFLPLLAGCPMGKMCTDLAAASALVHVVGPDGAPMVATVTAVDADGNDVEVTCADGSDGTDCTDWIVGYEVEGEIVITADANDGCNDGTGSVTVDVPLDEDECHVVQQEATLTVDEWTNLDCG